MKAFAPARSKGSSHRCVGANMLNWFSAGVGDERETRERLIPVSFMEPNAPRQSGFRIVLGSVLGHRENWLFPPGLWSIVIPSASVATEGGGGPWCATISHDSESRGAVPVSCIKSLSTRICFRQVLKCTLWYTSRGVPGFGIYVVRKPSPNPAIPSRSAILEVPMSQVVNTLIKYL